MSSTLIRDASLLFPGWFPFDELPDAGGLFDHLTFDDFDETWTADTVTLSTQVELDASLTFDLFGFDVGFGALDADVTTATLELILASEPVVTAIGTLLLGASLATAEDVADAANALGLEAMTAADIDAAHTAFETSGDDQPSLGDIRVELSNLTASIGLPEETFQVGKLLEANGEVVGIEPHPDDPRAMVELGEIELYADTAEGVGIDLKHPDSVSLPPLLFRDTQVGFELRDLVADLSATSTPEPVASLPGYDASWRGLYIGELTVWGLQTWLPFFPADLDSDAADGTSLTFSEWLIDHRGLVGAVTLSLPENHPSHADAVWKLDELTLAFDRDWVPETLAATVSLALSELSDDLAAIGSDGDVTLAVDLRYDPARPPAARFGFNLVARATEDGPLLDLTSDDLGSARGVIYTALAGLAVAGGTGASLFVGALAALEAADILTTDRFAIENLDFSYDAVQIGQTDSWKHVLAAHLDLAAEFTLDVDAADLNTPLGLKGSGVTIEYVTNHAALEAAGVSTAPVSVDWNLDDVAVSLQADANIGNAITISTVELRTEDSDFLIELGVETEGAGDVAIAGVPDAIIIVVAADGTISIRLGGGMPVTLLVPGVLYARGELQTGADAVSLPPAGDGRSWDGAMAGSLRGFLIGNGTATTPADHTKRESYMLGLDVGLLSAARSDGMTTLVVTIDGSFNPGIPLGTSGIGLYGLGLVYAQNAKPALPAPNDYAGWYMDEAPAYTTHASKWVPALDEWGFGASTIIGSAPDDARSWSAKVGLIILLPGPVIILAGTGDVFSEKPSMGGGDEPPFAAVVVLDLEDDVLTIDLRVALAIPEGDGPDLVTVTIPVEIFVNLADASDFHLYMGRYAPPEARVIAEALGMLDLSAYLMLDGSPITGLPTVDPLPGLALALGGEASIDWGLKSSVLKIYWYAEAGFHLGVSLADPPLLVGLVEIEGGIVVKVFGFGFDLGVFARLAGRAPTPFELTGEVGVKIDLPWPFDDINTSVSVTFGPGGDLPDAPNPLVDCQLRPRNRREAHSLLDAAADGGLTDVPIDPVFALSFDAPINGIGSVGSFTAATADGGADVWKVVTTEQAETQGVERRHRIGYRYELTDCTVKNVETGDTVADAPATWTPGGDAASASGAAAASGGQPARKDLLLFTHEATYLNRTVGLGGELSKRQTREWDPCFLKKPQARLAYDATGLPAGDDLTTPLKLTEAFRDTVGDPPVWGRVAPEGSAAARRMVDAAVVEGSVVRPPFEPAQAPRQPLQRDRLLGVPQVLPRSAQGLAFVNHLIGPEPQVNRLSAVEGEPADIPSLVDPLDIVLPAHEHAEVQLLVADDVQIVAIGLVDGDPATGRLPLTPLGQSFPLQGVTGTPPDTDKGWRFYGCAPPRPVDAIRLFAVRPPTLPHVPAALSAMAASVLSVEVRYGDRTNRAERDTLTELTADLVDATLRGEHLDMLAPGTEYELSMTVEATHAEQWGDDPVKVGDPAGSFTETISFTTAGNPPSTLRGTDDPDRTRDDWDIHALPDGSVPHYTESPATVTFRSARTLATYTAYGDALALRFVDEHGVDLFERADAIAERAADLPAEQAVWRSTLESLNCVDDRVGELWREATATIASLLEPATRYVTTLHRIDAAAPLSTIDWETAPAVYTWRFTTSRWASPGAHLASHELVDELTDTLPNAAGLRTATTAAATPETTVGEVTIDDGALDHLLFETLGLPPRRPPETPEAIRVWRWNPTTDDAAPVALVLDGPEPLLRDGVTLTVRQGSRALTGRFVTGESGARILFVPDAGELVAGQPARVTLSSTTQPLNVPFPMRPSVLSPGGAP
ncbi:hypothetical protein [Haladaptatus sp. ZSTT2]|uniref:hypothetical protein n=1 Tax=Haladaptatus sp. ZSTT2 TaxID=3120515 RepID=UPI00300EF74E